MRLIILLILFVSSPALALYEGLQCVPYARAVSGVQIRGDAHTWWDQAQGRYDRGTKPRAGAVLAFKPYGAMRLGHVAAVRKIIGDRTLLVSHANWSTIDGQRGHIEENVRVTDVSADNDWSEVQVWYTPNAAMGTTRWPVSGFIYPNEKRSDQNVRMAVADLTGGRRQVNAANAGLNAAAPQPDMGRQTLRFSQGLMAQIESTAAREQTAAPRRQAATRADPIGDLIANVSR